MYKGHFAYDIEEYNASESSPIPLRIACGYAIADLSKDSIRDTEIEADRLMYIDKAEIKKTESIGR